MYSKPWRGRYGSAPEVAGDPVILPLLIVLVCDLEVHLVGYPGHTDPHHQRQRVGEAPAGSRCLSAFRPVSINSGIAAEILLPQTYQCSTSLMHSSGVSKFADLLSAMQQIVQQAPQDPTLTASP